MPALVSLRGVSRSFADGDSTIRALVSVDFDLLPGELVAVTGRSGSGKSTLLNICGGIDRADGGSVRLADVDVAGASPPALAEIRRRHVGIVFQQLNLVPSLTAAENVALPLELDGMSARDARDQALSALAEVGLRGRERDFPDALSGGQRQRVAIARAVVGRRRILLADEPTGALDARSGEQILELLRAQADGGRAVMLVTHDRALAGLADRVVELRDGVIASVVERSTIGAALSGPWSR